MRLRRWTLPEGQVVLVSIYLTHNNEALFPSARSFDPDRFAGNRPDTYQWIPFDGGVRRCIGAAFAHMEMNVVPRRAWSALVNLIDDHIRAGAVRSADGQES